MKGEKIKMTATVRLKSGKVEKDSEPILTKEERAFCISKGFAKAETKEAKEPKKENE